MASRRPQAQSAAAPPSVGEKPSDSDVTPAVPSNVIFKLLGFSAAMISSPIGMYFVAVEFGGDYYLRLPIWFFNGDVLSNHSAASSTVAGIAAAITANVVLFAYIYVAWQDDQEEREALAKKKEKKAQ
ncbi:hypothetical protein EYZ11_002522 [Aspergillus tanneri]|uniref:Vacuolar ATPase assembly integral membrane protein vma21 n=1 Tax=Aspergillus tanneri TaxID=1220188 RepID=A0A4S3JRD8_9EURO|nr:vacuolar ATPase assembly integral membrane protein vma21 [Aspergillus tanneri]KAA8645945.1 vacuolar ATPase assembly integral membrane protein vma21 [Aspergillus tanneri]THC98020.1 hypothetical protein EYZ11_002522 [Aspergillus tanneri]